MKLVTWNVELCLRKVAPPCSFFTALLTSTFFTALKRNSLMENHTHARSLEVYDFRSPLACSYKNIVNDLTRFKKILVHYIACGC